jgi:hypothetical protein
VFSGNTDPCFPLYVFQGRIYTYFIREIIMTENSRAILSKETYSNMTEGYSKEFNKNIPRQNNLKIADSELQVASVKRDV